MMQRWQPDGIDTLMVEGQLRVREGQLDAATRAYDRAIAKYPRRIEPLIERANLADMQNQLDRAIDLIGKAAVLAPGDPRVLDLQVQFASEKGDWEKVRQLLGPHEIDLDPRTPNGLTYAEALLRLDHPEQARVMFARALLLSPQNPYSRMMLAEAQLATGDAETALRTIRPLSDRCWPGSASWTWPCARRARRAIRWPIPWLRDFNRPSSSVTKALPGRRRPRWQGGTGPPRLRPIRRCWAMAVMPKCSSGWRWPVRMRGAMPRPSPMPTVPC
jgi:Tfp pilus assembly protein PilF